MKSPGIGAPVQSEPHAQAQAVEERAGIEPAMLEAEFIGGVDLHERGGVDEEFQPRFGAGDPLIAEVGAVLVTGVDAGEGNPAAQIEVVIASEASIAAAGSDAGKNILGNTSTAAVA